MRADSREGTMTGRPCDSVGATATINTTCCGCGRDPRDTGADWTQCPSCGNVYCTGCVAERRTVGADTMCPCCGAADLLAAG
jgi:hypothetical protein